MATLASSVPGLPWDSGQGSPLGSRDPMLLDVKPTVGVVRSCEMEGFMKGIEIRKTAFLVVQRCVLPMGVDTTCPIREHRRPGSLASCVWRETGPALLLSLYFL